MKILKNVELGIVCFVRPELQFEFSSFYCSKHILVQQIIAKFSSVLLSLFWRR